MSADPRRHPSRRGVLKLLAGGSALAATATAGGLGAWWAGAAIDNTGAVDFTRPLPIPPQLQPAQTVDGIDRYELIASAGAAELLTGKQTTTWGFNGRHLGPTLRMTRGRDVDVRVRNELDETTTVHWHGMNLPARYDGGPHQPISSGAIWNPRWRVDQPAATLWYHPHPHGDTSRHVYRGLAGMLIIDDPAAPARLPGSYGVDDIPLILQDVSLDADGQLDMGMPLLAPLGRLGNTVLTNGIASAYLDITRQTTRLRILNGADARIFTLALDDGSDFRLVATDGGLLARPVPMTSLVLSPGERAEILVTMKAGERRILRNLPNDHGVDVWNRRFIGADDRIDLLELRAASMLQISRQVPSELGGIPTPAPASAAPDREFDIIRYQINGRPMDMGRIDFGVLAGSREVWRVRNRDGIPHNFHVHEVQFRVLDRDGTLPADLDGPKDTVFLPPQSTALLEMRFGEHADPDLPFMYHCHMLTHEDLGMMGQFVILADGQSVGAVPHLGHA